MRPPTREEEDSVVRGPKKYDIHGPEKSEPISKEVRALESKLSPSEKLILRTDDLQFLYMHLIPKLHEGVWPTKESQRVELAMSIIHEVARRIEKFADSKGPEKTRGRKWENLEPEVRKTLIAEILERPFAGH